MLLIASSFGCSESGKVVAATSDIDRTTSPPPPVADHSEPPGPVTDDGEAQPTDNSVPPGGSGSAGPSGGQPVPEPLTMLLIGSGLACVASTRRRKTNKTDTVDP